MESKHVGNRKRPKQHHNHNHNHNNYNHQYQNSTLIFTNNNPTSSSTITTIMDVHDDDENSISDELKKIKLEIQSPPASALLLLSSKSTIDGMTEGLDLPGTILMDITSRLSLKSIFELRGVSKSWRSLFSESYFYKLYSLHTSTSLILQLKFNSAKALRQIAIIDQHSGCISTMTKKKENGISQGVEQSDGLFPNARFQLGNGCNGLICLRQVQTREPSLVWNPVLGQFVVIPKPATTSDDKVVAGFGFCAPTNRYKVLRIFHKKGDPMWKQKAEVYELGVGTEWRCIGDVLLPIPSRIPGFFMNNSLHWILDCNNNGGGGNDSRVLSSKFELIVGFDFVEEKFKPIPSPPIFSVQQRRRYHWSNLGIIGSYLSICAINSKVFRPDVQVWVMEEYGVPESWVLRLSIRDPAVEWWDPYRWMQVTNFASNGEIFMLCAHSYVFAYNLESRQFRKIEVLDYPAIAHVPSFVSLEDVLNQFNVTGSLKVCYL